MLLNQGEAQHEAHHGYPAAASDLADRTLEWFEGRTSDWRRDLGQSYVYAMLLSVAGRWAESQLILEVVLEAYPERSNVALELAYVLVMQGHRDQAFRAIGLVGRSDNLVVRAWVEAALGERELAMELLWEAGFPSEGHRGNYWMDNSMGDYPPYQELIRTIRPNHWYQQQIDKKKHLSVDFVRKSHTSEAQ